MSTEKPSENDRQPKWVDFVVGGVVVIGILFVVLVFLGALLHAWLGWHEMLRWWLPAGGVPVTVLSAVLVAWRWPAVLPRVTSWLGNVGLHYRSNDVDQEANARSVQGPATAQNVDGSHNVVTTGDVIYGAAVPAVVDVPSGVRPRMRPMYTLVDRGTEILDIVDSDGQPVGDALAAKTLLEELLEELARGGSPDLIHRQTVAEFVEKAAKLQSYHSIGAGQDDLRRLAEALRQ